MLPLQITLAILAISGKVVAPISRDDIDPGWLTLATGGNSQQSANEQHRSGSPEQGQHTVQVTSNAPTPSLTLKRKRGAHYRTPEHIEKIRAAWTSERRERQSEITRAQKSKQLPYYKAKVGGDSIQTTVKSVTAPLAAVEEPNSGSKKRKGQHYKTPEHIQAIRAAWTPERRKKQAEYTRAHQPKRGPEFAEKIKASWTEERRKSQAEITRKLKSGYVHSKETRAKMAKTRLGMKRSEATKKKIREAVKRSHALKREKQEQPEN